MDLSFENNEEYQTFIKELKERVKSRECLKLDIPDFKQSAVMILLMNKDGKAHVFLTKRTEKVKTHKGDVSFPGGGCEDDDKDLLRTALRETYEEAGIIPEDIEIIGQFDDYFSIRRFHVSTFIGSINYPYKYKINNDEIESYLEAPLSIFYNKEVDKVEHYHFDGKDVEVLYYFFDGFMIWGLTARILTDFACEVLKNS